MRDSELPHRKYHATRHSYATWAIEGGEPIERVSKYMGHASIQQTIETYFHAVIGNRGELQGMRDAMRGVVRLALPAAE